MRNPLSKSITTLVFVLWTGLFSIPSFSQDKPLLKPDAPDRYVVVPGDTLWSIAQRYLSAPYRWTELWGMNKDGVRNPNRIFPGDVLVLDRSKGQLALDTGTVKLKPRVRAEMAREAEVPSIPPNLIEPYLARPLVIDADGLAKAPAVVSTEEGRVILGPGNIAYVSGLAGSKEDTWHFYRQGKALVDPETGQTVGFEANHLGTGRVKSRSETSEVEIVAATHEIAKGDRLVAAGRPAPVTYAPRAPSKRVAGQVMSVYGAAGMASEAGQHSVVTINRGTADGLEVGHVLALYRAGVPINAPRGTLGFLAPKSAADNSPRTPEERLGLLFVFRVFDRVSYGLVMEVLRPVNPKDGVRNP